MFQKLKKTILYIAFLVMLIIAGYIIFIRDNTIVSKPYFLITAIAFILSCTVLIFVIFKGKLSDKKSIKLMIILVIILVIFQLVSLPVANFYSQSLPVWPRGTIYQMPRLISSIAQTDVGLLMRYYLDGKILHANKDYPIGSHKGFLYITDEYKFVKGDYPVMPMQQADLLYKEYGKMFSTITVRENPKLKINSFKIFLYIGYDLEAQKDIILLTDENNSWYFMPQALFEEVNDE